MRRLIAVLSTWLGQYITTEIGAIHDFYIAEYDKSNNEMKLLGFVYGNDTQRGLESTDI